MPRYDYSSSTGLGAGFVGFFVTCPFRKEQSATKEAVARLSKLLGAAPHAAPAPLPTTPTATAAAAPSTAAAATGVVPISGGTGPPASCPAAAEQAHLPQGSGACTAALRVVKSGGGGCVLLRLLPSPSPSGAAWATVPPSPASPSATVAAQLGASGPGPRLPAEPLPPAEAAPLEGCPEGVEAVPPGSAAAGPVAREGAALGFRVETLTLPAAPVLPSPVLLLERLLLDIEQGNEPRFTHVERIMPVEATCLADLQALASAVQPMARRLVSIASGAGSRAGGQGEAGVGTGVAADSQAAAAAGAAARSSNIGEGHGSGPVRFAVGYRSRGGTSAPQPPQQQPPRAGGARQQQQPGPGQRCEQQQGQQEGQFPREHAIRTASGVVEDAFRSAGTALVVDLKRPDVVLLVEVLPPTNDGRQFVALAAVPGSLVCATSRRVQIKSVMRQKHAGGKAGS